MNLTPWNILSAHVAADVTSDDWNLAEPPDEPDSPRSYWIDVAFATAFSAPPVVHLGLTGFDSDQRDSTRISIRPVEITASGFRVEVSTWSVTRLYGVEVSWLAIGP
ncbi:hypothetical protein HAHE_19740 [Haloferula helveola]|uniref:H-type lectin domain-containing protein n=1 Tax=Haloferula helveola TaxID=490095 RepID=A0ABM7REG1_9BACT|nr:hypothetical protein HAHE_19740 [Haloferula helveola]